MKKLVLKTLGRLRAVGQALRGDELSWMPAGHFYSPILSLEERDAFARENDQPPPRSIPGIDMRESEQLALLQQLKPYYRDLLFGPDNHPPCRFQYDNSYFSFADAVLLFCMLRHLRPRRIFEVGSGYSSALMLDTSERFLDDRIQLTCIEPYPDQLLALLRQTDRDRIELIARKVQEVDPERFATLAAGDILFIDSTHVCKPRSDVNYLLAQVLPVLADGVWIHFHDVFHPFEYPGHWVQMGIAWNEIYMLRSFLQYNRCFQIELFQSFLWHFHREEFRDMPLCLTGPAGSIWLRKNSAATR